MIDAVDFFHRRFTAAGSPARATQQKRYMKSALGFYGVDAAEVRDAARDFCATHALDHEALVSVVDDLFASDRFDLHSAAVAILERQRKLIVRDDADWLIALVRRAGCWAHVDWLATKIVPRALDGKPGKQLRAWAKDDDFWVRRTALLAQLDCLRAGDGDFALFCALAEPMLPEREFFIRKAIGWVLREVGKKRPALVRAFVDEHGAKMSGLTKREALKRLGTRQA